MDKQTIATVSILLVVVGSVTGILGTQINRVDARVDDMAPIVYVVPTIDEKLEKIELKIDRVNDKLDNYIINRGQTAPAIP